MRCTSLRSHADYDLCDSRMIDDGFLSSKTDLLLPASCHVTESTAAALTKFVRDGGRVWVARGVKNSDDLQVQWILDFYRRVSHGSRTGTTDACHHTAETERTIGVCGAKSPPYDRLYQLNDGCGYGTTVVSISKPCTITLLLCGLAGLALWRRR